MTKDMGRGLGPEVYLIRKAVPGVYRIQVKLFNALGRTITYVFFFVIPNLIFSRPVNAMVRIYTNFGTPHVKERCTMATLKEDKQVVTVATVTC